MYIHLLCRDVKIVKSRSILSYSSENVRNMIGAFVLIIPSKSNMYEGSFWIL